MKQIQFLTRQVIFDQAVVHPLAQRRAALLPRGGGAYYGGDGICPVGNMIEARDHATSIEGVPVRYIFTHTKDVPQHLTAGVDALDAMWEGSDRKPDWSKTGLAHSFSPKERANRYA